MFQSQVSIGGASPDPAVQLMYDRLRGGQGLGVTRGAAQYGRAAMAPYLNHNMKLAGMQMGNSGLTDYELALGPINASLFLQAQNQARQNDLRMSGLANSASNYGMSQVMQLLSPFLKTLIGPAG